MAADSSSRSRSRTNGPALLPLGHHTGKPPVPLHRPVTLIGSRSNARIHLLSSTVSKAHALLVKSNGGMYIRDLASRSHVYVNGQQIREADLNDGDLIKIGSFTFRYVAGPQQPHDARSPGGAELDVTGGEFPIPVDQRVLLIGRRSTSDIVLLEDSASTAHAVIFEMDGDRYVRDLGSRTGTFVNGVSTHQHKLSPGDVIRIGESDLEYRAAADAEFEAASESAAAYLLEAPGDEIEPPAVKQHQDEEHETVGGLDLMGQLVTGEIPVEPASDARVTDDEPPLAAGEAEPAETEAVELETADLQSRQPGTVEAREPEPAVELDPLKLAEEAETAAHAEAPAAATEEQSGSEDEEREAGEAAVAEEKPDVEEELDAKEIPVADEEPVAQTAGPETRDSADIVDLQHELLGEAARAEESSSLSDSRAETLARDSQTPAESPVEPPPLPLDEQGSGPSTDETLDHGPLTRSEQTAAPTDLAPVEADEPIEPVEPVSADAELHPRRGWRSAIGEQTEPAEPTETAAPPEEIAAPPEPLEAIDDAVEPEPQEQATQEQSSEVLRFSEPTSTIDRDDAHDVLDDSRAGGTAVLDQDALETEARDQHDQPAFDIADTFAPVGEELPPLAPLDVEPPDLKLDFSDSLPPASQDDPKRTASVDLSQIDLSLEPEPAPSEMDAGLEPVAEEPHAPQLDFSVKEPVEPSASLLDLDKLPPPPPLKLTDEAEAYAQATAALTRRRRKPKKNPDEDAPVEPFVALEPQTLTDPFTAPPQIEPIDPFVDIDAPAEAEHAPSQTPLDELPPLRLDLTPPPDDSGVEVLAESHPEPESALNLDVATEDAALDDSAIARALAEADSGAGEDLTDTKFARDVRDFATDELGEIVETPAGAAADEPAAARAEVDAGPIDPHDLPAPLAGQREDAPADEPERERGPEPAPASAGGAFEVPPAPAPAPPAGATPSRTLDRFQVGANQENFLGGTPVPRSPRRVPPGGPAPLGRDPVEALIAEIDTAAAAAERSRTSHPAARGDVPAQPPRLDESIPPYTGSDAKGSQVTTGFDGLAMPPVRQTDVFARMSPPQSDAGGGGGVGTPADRSRRRPLTGAVTMPRSPFFAGHAARAADPDDTVAALPPDLPGHRPVHPGAPAPPTTPPPNDPFGPPQALYADDPDVEYGDEPEDRPPAQRRMLTLALIGLALIAAAVGGVYGLMPVRAQVEAGIQYRNLAKRIERDRRDLQEDQLRRLQSDYLRRAARSYLLQTPEVSPGFLEDTVAYSRTMDRAFWTEGKNDSYALVLRAEGSNRQADSARLRAVAAALYNDNRETLIRPAREARTAVQQLRDAITSNERRRDELNGEIATQRIFYEQRPTADQVRLMEEKLARLEQAWKRAVSAVKDAEAELDRLRSGAAVAVADGVEAVEAQDEELAEMRRELQQLQARAQASRDAAAERAGLARRELDLAMESFQQEIASARDAMHNNPELAAYIAAAQQLQDATRQLIDDLIRRQQQQFHSLMELKERLHEKMESRRKDMWQADKELQELTERLAILTRQLNAAVGAGLREETEELRAQVDLTRSMIRARQDLIPVDPGYAEAIQQIELFISSTQKNIAEDRSRTDELLARLQSGFTSSPTMERLPAEQKELAARLVTKLESINEARGVYNQALDAGAEAESDGQLRQQIAALQSGIEARREQLAAQRVTDAAVARDPEVVMQKQAELDQLNAAASEAADAYFAAREELDNARKIMTNARASYEKLEKLEAERNNLMTLLKTQNDTLVERQREAGSAVEPLELTENDIRVVELADRRPMVAGVAAGMIAISFASLIGLTWMRTRREQPETLVPADLRPIAHPVPQPSAHGSAVGNGAAHHTADASGKEDDREPAVI